MGQPFDSRLRGQRFASRGCTHSHNGNRFFLLVLSRYSSLLMILQSEPRRCIRSLVIQYSKSFIWEITSPLTLLPLEVGPIGYFSPRKSFDALQPGGGHVSGAAPAGEVRAVQEDVARAEDSESEWTAIVPDQHEAQLGQGVLPKGQSRVQSLQRVQVWYG